MNQIHLNLAVKARGMERNPGNDDTKFMHKWGEIYEKCPWRFLWTFTPKVFRFDQHFKPFTYTFLFYYCNNKSDGFFIDFLVFVDKLN